MHYVILVIDIYISCLHESYIIEHSYFCKKRSVSALNIRVEYFEILDTNDSLAVSDSAFIVPWHAKLVYRRNIGI